jgi:GH24 family phage-related lysozyme (muramidase)
MGRKSITAVEVVSKPGIKNIELIKKHEGLRLQAYLPTPNDKWTIGYGHTKTAQKGMVITEERAEELLRQDVAWVEAAIAKLVKVKLTQNQYDALASLIFNIGEGAFARSSVLRELNEGNYQDAANAFMMWNKQRSKTTGKMNVLKGLTKRREEERNLFLTK